MECGRVEVELGDGTVLPADLVVLGLGSVPATELFAGQLDMDRGAILVRRGLTPRGRRGAPGSAQQVARGW